MNRAAKSIQGTVMSLWTAERAMNAGNVSSSDTQIGVAYESGNVHDGEPASADPRLPSAAASISGR